MADVWRLLLIARAVRKAEGVKAARRVKAACTCIGLKAP
jgi:hypothetical protein